MRSVRIGTLLILGSSLTALLVGEAILGRVFPNEYYVWPPHLKRVFKPDPRYVPGISGKSRFEINSMGLRANSNPPTPTGY